MPKATSENVAHKQATPAHKSAGRVALVCVLLGLALFAFYASLAARDVYWSDSAEFVLVADTWSIAHPSGYPLYTLLSASAAALSPLPSAFTLSLLSALFAALALALMAGILMREGVRPPLAVAAMLLTGLSRSWVDQALVPEVYSLNACLQVAALAAFLAWRRRPSISSWALSWLAFGLAFSNHLTSFWLVGPLAILLFVERKRLRRLKSWLLAVGMFALGLTPYLYLPIRAASDPFYNQGDPSTLARMVEHITGAIYRYRLFTMQAGDVGHELGDWARSLADQWHWAVLLLLVPGAILLVRKLERAQLAGLAVYMFIGLLYVSNYFIPDKDGYYLTLHMLAALVIALGAFAIVERASRRVRVGSGLAGAVFVALALVPAWQARTWSQADNSSLRDYTVDLWRGYDGDTLLLTEDISVHFGTLLLQREGVIARDKIVISQYLLPFEWYRDFVRERWPALDWPHDWDALVGRFRALSDESAGERLGQARQRVVEEMSRALVRANMGRRTVAAVVVEDEHELLAWLDFPVRNHGLSYTIIDGRSDRSPVYACDYSAKYLSGKSQFHDWREKRLSSAYATACNRLGIARVKEKEPEAALRAFKRALRYDPDYAQAMKNAGLILIDMLDRVPEGLGLWRRYLEATGGDADPAVRARVRRMQQDDTNP